MTSSNTVNFGVRQNKSIERNLVFEGLRAYLECLSIENAVYIGLGSAWFVDFEHAHRTLGIETMISIENDDTTYERAKFNRPYRTVEIIHGTSHSVIPTLFDRADLNGRPWVVWLDYDRALDPDSRSDLIALANRAPTGTALLTTFSAHPKNYGTDPGERLDQLLDLFGDAFPIERHPGGRGLSNPRKLQRVLSTSLLNDLDSTSRRAARPGGFVHGFDIHYQDGAPMVTAGGFLPSQGDRQLTSSLMASEAWRCLPEDPINTPPLTPKEIAALRSLLPASSAPTRADIQDLGFDLKDEHLSAFVRYYLDYPIYVEAARL